MPKDNDEKEFHRKTAASCFNQAWDYLEKKKKRSSDEDLQLLHLSHASRYHWGLAGTPRNIAVGDWQLSRVYADIGHPKLALRFASSCLDLCQKNNLSDIEHTANEALARAYAANKDYRNAKIHLERARQQLDKLEIDKDDREIYLDQIKETESLIRK